MTKQDVKGFIVNRETITFVGALLAVLGVFWTVQGYIQGIERDVIELQRDNLDLSTGLKGINTKLDQIISEQGDQRLAIQDLKIRRELERGN